MYDFLVARQQFLPIHFGDEVQGIICIVSAEIGQYTAFLFQPPVQLCFFWSVEQSYHGGNDTAFLNKIDLSLKY